MKRRENSQNNIKTLWGKFWFLLWKDDSFKGWLFSIVFLFIFIKFIFFPVLSLITGTALPLAIVESCSMYHEGNFLSDFNSWWDNNEDKYEEFTINELDFMDFPFLNGFNKGDILFIIGAKPEKLQEGDVIIFNANQRNPVIHRIVNIETDDEKYYFSSIGDNNPAQISFEQNINENQIVGKAVFRLAPYVGWGKLIFFESQKPQNQRGFCN